MVHFCFCVVARWLPACFVIAAICPIVLVLSRLAWVGFSALVCFRSRSFSRLSCSFLLAVLLPVRVPSGSVLVPFWFHCRPFSGGGGVPPVVLAISVWGLCPVVVACGGVVLCSFPLSFVPPKGGWVGVVGLAILLSNPKVSSGKLHRLAGRV